jgi:tetratricopeptide (TPR) repeat protein
MAFKSLKENILMILKKWLIALAIALITLVSCSSHNIWQLELVETYNDQVVQYYQQGLFQQALPLAEKALKMGTEKLGEKHLTTLASLNNLAGIYVSLGRRSEALPLLEKSYRLYKEVLGEKHPDTLMTINNLAITYLHLGRLSDALPLFEKGYRLYKEVLGEKHPDTLMSLNNLASFYRELGRLSDALAWSEKGYRLSKEVLGEKHPETLTALTGLATIYQDLGRLSKALHLYETCYRLRKEVLGEQHSDTIFSLNNLAVIYISLGRLSDALPLFEKGYRLRSQVLGKKHPDTLRSFGNLAAIYQDLGRLEEALPLFEKSYDLFKEVLGEKHPDTLKSLNNLARIYQDLGRLSEALPLFEKGYRLYKKILGEKNIQTLWNISNLSIIYKYLGKLSEALPLSEKGYRLYTEELGENHPDTLRSMSILAGIYQDLGRLSEALPLYKKAYHLSKEKLGEQHSATIADRSNLAHAYVEQGETNQAIKHFEKLVEGVENLRSGDFSAENRQSLFKKWVAGYFELSDLYIDQSRPQDAFRLAEMSKARTLLESLAAKLAAQQSGLTATEQQKLQDFEASDAFLNNRIAKAWEENRLEEKITLETEKNQLVKKLNQFHHELMAKYPKYAQLSNVQIIGAKEGAKFLPKNAVLISYLVEGNHILAFTLQTNGKLTTYDLGKMPNLEKDLEDYRLGLAPIQDSSRGQKQVCTSTRNQIVRFCRSKRKQETQALGKQLGKRLLEPLKNIIKDKPHWIISPSGALALIPFETLRFEGEKQPVIAQHQISYVQSLSILAMLQKRDKAYKGISNRGSLLAMGSPFYEKTTTTSNPSTTDFKIARQLVMRGGDYGRAFEQLNLKWKNLPGALEELSQLEKLFKETKPHIYKQAQATEAKLQTLNQQGLLAQHRYLVFSAHGYLSDDVPALSSIVLGQVNNSKGIDGYVTAGEWPGYDLKSDLMVLSACETGLGEVVGGEGVMGLPYAFYVAGNKNTILTLWSISDKVTAEFITSFFRKLKAGRGQVEALTATKREFLNKGKPYNNPKYWAAFVLYGI